MAEEKGLQVDMAAYERAMTEAREMSRGARTKASALCCSRQRTQFLVTCTYFHVL